MPKQRRIRIDTQGELALVQRVRHARGTQERAAQLGLQPGLVAGLVHEVDHRQAKQAAQLDVALHLVGGLEGHGAALHLGVVGDHADRHAVQPRQRGDDRAALPAPDLEHGVPVHDAGQDLARVVDLAAVARDGVFQPVVGAVRSSLAGSTGAVWNTLRGR
jgi:hypothetical protein